MVAGQIFRPDETTRHHLCWALSEIIIELSGLLDKQPVRKSSARADQFFQAVKSRCWISVYSAVVSFVELSTPGGDACTPYLPRS
jgi:hypothetical protein